MNREDIIRMAREAGWDAHHAEFDTRIQTFAALVASAERERIKQANAPEIERINAYIKEALAQPEQALMNYYRADAKGNLERTDIHFVQPEQDGKCKHCKDGCAACDARKLPKQEPVAWAKFSAKGNIIDLLSEHDDDYTPLYTTPPQCISVGLTEDEILSISADCASSHQHMDIHFAKAIEAKLRRKNNG